MAALGDIKKRIQSVKNTQQITRAMKLVAAAKMRRAQENALSARPYAEKMREVLSSLSARTEESSHPFFTKREETNILILLCSSDKGLCGPFNANLFRAASELIRENEGKGIFMAAVGGKGVDFFKSRNVEIQNSYLDYSKKIGYALASEIGHDAVENFTREKVDKVYLIYNRFVSVLKQDVMTSTLLPVEQPVKTEQFLQGDESMSVDTQTEYLYEPSAEAMLSDILKKNIEVQIYQALLESWASENGARMAAMDSATNNAQDVIARLTLQYNRARQAAITTELIEILSGADALKA